MTRASTRLRRRPLPRPRPPATGTGTGMETGTATGTRRPGLTAGAPHPRPETPSRHRAEPPGRTARARHALRALCADGRAAGGARFEPRQRDLWRVAGMAARAAALRRDRRGERIARGSTVLRRTLGGAPALRGGSAGGALAAG